MIYDKNDGVAYTKQYRNRSKPRENEENEKQLCNRKTREKAKKNWKRKWKKQSTTGRHLRG